MPFNRKVTVLYANRALVESQQLIAVSISPLSLLPMPYPLCSPVHRRPAKYSAPRTKLIPLLVGAKYTKFDDFAEDFFSKYLLLSHGVRFGAEEKRRKKQH